MKYVTDSEIWVVPKEPLDFEINENGSLTPFPITFPNMVLADAMIRFYSRDLYKIWLITETKQVQRFVTDTLFERALKFLKLLFP